MKTIVINVPDNQAQTLRTLLRRMRLSARVVGKQEKEEAIIARMIDEGMKTKEVSEEQVVNRMKKNGLKI